MSWWTKYLIFKIANLAIAKNKMAMVIFAKIACIEKWLKFETHEKLKHTKN
jgi:hypothetical protein